MAPVIPDPKKIRAFKDSAAFEAWLSANHNKETELWLKIFKKASGRATVTYAEALDVALCWGWIDGLKKSFDDEAFIQRFTPRQKKSIWSQINRGHIERLIAAGRMTKHGMAAVDAAKADGRWAAAYAPPSKMQLPDDLVRAIRAVPKAAKTFDGLDKQSRFAFAFRLTTIKTSATRERKIAEWVAMLARGEAIHLFSQAKKTPVKKKAPVKKKKKKDR